MIVHDLRCPACEAERFNVRVTPGNYPRCKCGAQMVWKPAGFKSDVWGSERYCIASGEYHRSQRDQDKRMRELGFEPRGDKVGGARIAKEGNLGTSSSYPGQRVRRTFSQERGIEK